MPQKSSITKLDPRIRAELDRLIREDGYTIDGLLAAIQALGGQASRSAVGRYAKNTEEQIARMKELNSIAQQWIGELKVSPEGDTGRMLSELLRTIIYQQMDKLSTSERTGAMDVMLISKALKDLAGTDKLTIERIEKIKQITRQEAAAAVDQVKKKGGLSDETAEAIRRQILGLPPTP